MKGIVDTREYSTTVKTVQPLPRVTWADVVKGTTQGKAIRGQEKMLKYSVSNKSVSRPLSRNNPVSKVKVKLTTSSLLSISSTVFDKHSTRFKAYDTVDYGS